MPLTKLYPYNFQEKYGNPNPKGEFPQYPFLLFREKVYAFSSAFLYVHIRTNQTVTYQTKVFPKKIFCKGVQLYFEILILLFIQKIFEHTRKFYLYVTVHLVRIWTYKNADEKAHTFSKRNKHIKKWIMCKFTLTQVVDKEGSSKSHYLSIDASMIDASSSLREALIRAKSTDRDKLTANQRFGYSNFITK